MVLPEANDGGCVWAEKFTVCEPYQYPLCTAVHCSHCQVLDLVVDKLWKMRPLITGLKTVCLRSSNAFNLIVIVYCINAHSVVMGKMTAFIYLLRVVHLLKKMYFCCSTWWRAATTKSFLQKGIFQLRAIPSS